MGIIAWIALGLGAGLLANMLIPGRRSQGVILTCVVGVARALLGGWLAKHWAHPPGRLGAPVNGLIQSARYPGPGVGRPGDGSAPASMPNSRIRANSKIRESVVTSGMLLRTPAAAAAKIAAARQGPDFSLYAAMPARTPQAEGR
jgi:uncharacterized membrane protein YeaQ/YmgE (transglycosylase-associated protein family)